MRMSGRIVISTLYFTVSAAVAIGQARSHHCTKEPTTTTTRWGGNERIEVDMRDEPVDSVTGIVLWPGDTPLGDSLVQAFPRKPSDPLYTPLEGEHGVAVAACVTGADGLFAFSLSSGEYELRASLNKGIDVTSVFITVKRGSRQTKRIRVVMHPGT